MNTNSRRRAAAPVEAALCSSLACQLMYISASKSSDGSYAKNLSCNVCVYLLWRDSQRYSPHIYDLVRLHARQVEVKTCCV